MKIKRFLAPDMRTALQHVRQEHGPDAVILSNRVTSDGVEIVAASQYDEDMVRDAAEPAATAPDLAALAAPAFTSADAGSTDSAFLPPSAPKPAASSDMLALTPASPAPVQDTVSSPLDEPLERTPSPALAALLAPVMAQDDELPPAAVATEEPTPEPVPPPFTIPELVAPAPTPIAAAPEPEEIMAPATPAPAPTPVVQPAAEISPAPLVQASASDAALSTQMRDEFARMRQLLERGLNRMNDERLRCSPARQQVMDWMDEQGFTADIVREVAMALPADTSLYELHAKATALIGERLPISPSNFLAEGGAIALIGPSGAGKTSTVGKLAAHYSARHGVRDIALISLDHARPGGSDRLYCLARQLGIAAHEADSSQALVTLLQRLQDYRVILIDSPGVTPRHPQAAEQLNWLRNAEGVRSLLVLPANTHPVDLDDMVRRFQPAEPQGVIVTRLDETRRPGGVLSVVAQQQLPLAWVSDGQHLHDDLHRAEAACLLQRLPLMDSPAPAPYDPVAALVAHHAFA